MVLNLFNSVQGRSNGFTGMHEMGSGGICELECAGLNARSRE